MTPIPEHYGNQATLATELKINRYTVRTFHRDTWCEAYIIYIGVLMTEFEMKGIQE
ncbi:NinH [Salmonella enterica subsp. enterica]|uniref:NinH n=1 Tax=Morganella morganii TaxID=582 RepID=A0A8I0U2V7_MORMO|nr:NinH [Morganella morganii]EAB6540033.1 NinH [Salmonella enterica subsp. enterica serovar Typhimurium]EBQ6113601.1 NinH [Salmonella enterica subsp. enterica serovar Enteritidis]RNT10534.1 NinH [Morganella morganii subsp. morganii]HAE77906.1 NinH [Morganella sp. (in: enterobacteria)]